MNINKGIGFLLIGAAALDIIMGFKMGMINLGGPAVTGLLGFLYLEIEKLKDDLGG